MSGVGNFAFMRADSLGPDESNLTTLVERYQQATSILRQRIETIAQSTAVAVPDGAFSEPCEVLVERINQTHGNVPALLDAMKDMERYVRGRLAISNLEGLLFLHFVVGFRDLFDRFPASEELRCWRAFIEALVKTKLRILS